MKKIKKIFCFVICLLLIASSVAEANSRAKIKNIVALFTRVNPALSSSRATDYAKVIIKASEKYKQDPYIIAAMIVHESTVNEKAISKGGDYGLMQVRWKVHAKAIKQQYPSVKNAKDFLSPRFNIMFGTRILSECMNKAGNDTRKGIQRYSGGNTKLASKVINTANDLRAKDKNR